ncbi:MAG: type III-B CRISPR module RAMP protein Cmr1 [bacterium]|nr:type III-B CRISPR module RAMP protein Cmr1 [bacterium]
MTRKRTTVPLPQDWDPQRASEALQRSTFTYACEVVTPLFGGGVKAGVVDAEMPVRATTIRGQLRFFWRLLNRQRFIHDGKVNFEDLFVEERSIFGGLGNSGTIAASRIAVHISNVRNFGIGAAAKYSRRPDGNLKTLPDWEDWAGGQAVGYALFPAQGSASRERIRVEPSLLARPGFRFDLSIDIDASLCGKKSGQVEEAVRWWASFGGVGARTRRGAGAVFVTFEDKSLVPVSREDAQSKGCTLVVQQTVFAKPVAAWSAAIAALQTFRQGVGLARESGNNNRPGRSRWPEPDAIRRIVGTNSPGHKPVYRADNWFPRAAFGLPIIFHFKDADAGDPHNSTLHPVMADRMASPLVIRPYWNGSDWLAAALLMPIEEPDQLILAVDDAQHAVKTWPVDPREQMVICDSFEPMSSYADDGVSDPLSVFLAYFAELGSTSTSSVNLSDVLPHQSNEQIWTGAQINQDKKNGSLTAKQMKKGRPSGSSAFAHADDAEQLILQLPIGLQEKLKRNPITATAVVVDKTLIRIEVQT